MKVSHNQFGKALSLHLLLALTVEKHTQTSLGRLLWLYQAAVLCSIQGASEGRTRPNHYPVAAPDLDLRVFVP